jgi:hypothetical protein
VNHGFARGLVRRFLGSEGTRRKNIYMRLAKGKRQIFLAKNEAKFSNFHYNFQLWSGFWIFGL